MNKALFISVKPEFVAKIFDGSKTIELRKSIPKVNKGDLVIIYSTSPVMSIIGTCEVKEVIVMEPERLWLKFQSKLGIDKFRYFNYFEGKSISVGIVLINCKRFNQPITLSNFRRSFVKFQPPQTYKYLDKRHFEGAFM
ncbi:MAG: ASCH domain-containing protein [Bacteroidia bacterium]|nr:ASCH domain-containing protein [Bacteroidia bacterium]